MACPGPALLMVALLLSLLCPTEITGESLDKHIPVTDVNELYQALLAKSTHIVVNVDYIEAGKGKWMRCFFKKIVDAPATSLSQPSNVFALLFCCLRLGTDFIWWRH